MWPVPASFGNPSDPGGSSGLAGALARICCKHLNRGVSFGLPPPSYSDLHWEFHFPTFTGQNNTRYS